MAGYFLFFRCWPGFSESFPFERFNGLSDEELGAALKSYALEQLRTAEVRERIKQVGTQRRKAFKARTAALKRQSSKRMGGPTKWPTPPLSPRKSFRQERREWVQCADRSDPLICRLGAYLGWWHSEIIGVRLPMSRTWFHETRSREFAEQLVVDLNARSSLDYDTHEIEHHFNPRAGFISADALSNGQRATIRRCITAIQEGKEPAVEGRKLALVIGKRAIQVANELSAAWRDEERSDFEIPEEPIPPELGKRRSFNGDKNGGPPSQPVLTIGTWEELGIGIDKDGSYLGISPPPDFGAVFPKDKATKLDLPGDQWENLLDLLARSKDGNSAQKQDVMIAFGYQRRGKLSREDIEELSGDANSMREFDESRNKLTVACANLSRRLRDKIQVVTPGNVAVLSVAEERVVNSRFTVRHLLRGSDGKLRFGKAE